LVILYEVFKHEKRKLTFLFLILLSFGNIGMAMADNTEVHQSQRKITGRVMDVNGELLIGVNVMEVGTTNGTVTDINGTYIITLTSERPVLRFTYVGFRVKEVTVGTQGIIDVTLEEDVEALDEVVVVGYGTQKKASVVGSITNIEPGKLQLTPSRSLSNNLAGMVSGVDRRAEKRRPVVQQFRLLDPRYQHLSGEHQPPGTGRRDRTFPA